MHAIKVFVSNSLGNLADALKGARGGTLIVPSEEVKLDLYLKWLEKSTIVMGIKCLTYKEFMRRVFPEMPCLMELTLRIESQLDKVEEVREYVQDQNKKIKLASQLSALFLKYLRHDVEVQGWQKKVWDGVFPVDPTVAIEVQEPLYFFHTREIAPYEWRALSKMDTTWFHYTPSAMYVGDLLSERKQSYLLGKTAESAQEALEEYFEHDSPLLSNWGVLGQKTERLFEEADRVELFSEPTQALKREWLTLEREVADDEFIELHSATSPLREAEVVWEIIQRLPYAPREIVVLAPDMDLYAAMIEWVFKQRGGPFNYSIAGLKAAVHSPFLQGFQALMTLPKHRFGREHFAKLLVCEPFLKRFQLEAEEAEILMEWMERLNLRYDLEGHANSWHAVLKRVMEGFAVNDSDIDMSDAPLVSRWIEMTLKLGGMTDGEKRSAAAWAELLEKWSEEFFATGSEELAPFIAVLKNERIEGIFPFETIEHLMQSVFDSPSGAMNGGAVDSVRFTSMKLGSLMHAKAVICMGMHEGSFPRGEVASTLAQGVMPGGAEEDRYLFLEAVLGAQEKLILTYQRVNPEDGKEMHVSPVVEELRKDRGVLTTVHHPASALDLFYYQDKGFRSYSRVHYELCKGQKVD